MKRKIAAITAFIIGISYCSSDAAVMAAQNNPRAETDWEKADMKELPENMEPGTPELNSLQLPQKLGVVIDPWNVDGKGQIYSDEYVIRNMGENTGILKLSNLVCRPRERSGVTIKTNKSGIHDNEEKSVYMEMVFGSEDRIVLSEAGSEYAAELKPGEELSVCFTGEVNENTSEEWKNEEVTVGVVYSWDVNEKEEDETQETDEKESQTEEGSKEAEEIVMEEIIIENMNILQENVVGMDLCTIDENGQMQSRLYAVQNTGENTGRLSVSDLTCKSGRQEQSEIPVRTVWEETDAQEEPCIYIEMIPEDGEKTLLFQKNQEKTGFEMELEPGEKVIFHFAGELKGIRADDLKEEDLELMGTISWSPKETIS